MAGIYIHIPFCKQKCTYCDFHFSTTFHSYKQRMLDALCKEIELRKEELQREGIETIYFGGGTPSLLEESELQQLLIAISGYTDIPKVKEITLEANPDDINQTSIQSWKKLGINRLSIGLQSFKESDLKWMNRAHSVEEALQCVQLAVENGIPNITVDLLYGLPGLTNEEWVQHIEKVVEMGVQHVSAYCLTVEERTGLSHLIKQGKIEAAGEHQQADQFILLVETLEKHGFQQYEISNFCKPGFESLHNGSYWKGVHYVGIGPSAHSFDGKSRSWNVRNNHHYMDAVEKNTFWYETEELSLKDQFNELLLIGLRTTAGVSLQQLAQLLPLDSSFNNQVQVFIQDQLMISDGNYISLTPKGRLQADRIASDLFCIDK